MYDTLYAIVNKSENATLQYLIFCKKALDEKYLLKLYNIFKTSIPASDSPKLHQFVSFDVRVNSFFLCLKFYSLNFAIAHTQKNVMLIRIRHTCVALIHKITVLSLETSSKINFEFIKFVKKN